MSHFKQLRQLYTNHEAASVDLFAFLNNPQALVVSNPWFTSLVRPCRKDWSADRFADVYAQLRPGEVPDCWHVWALAGDWRRAMGYLPAPLPWIAWARNNVRLRFWKTERLLQFNKS